LDKLIKNHAKLYYDYADWMFQRLRLLNENYSSNENASEEEISAEITKLCETGFIKNRNDIAVFYNKYEDHNSDEWCPCLVDLNDYNRIFGTHLQHSDRIIE
jgi:hypothetical protein